MGFLKNIARKVLYFELKEKDKTIGELKDENADLREKLKEYKREHESKINKLEKDKIEITAEKIGAERRTKEVEKENQILRQYYDLDKEPSDEIKTKIHIDLEINRLKEENLKLTVMCNRPPMFIPQYYPNYGLGRGLI